MYVSKCILKIQVSIHGTPQKAQYHPSEVWRNNKEMQWSPQISCFNLNMCNFQACNLTIKIWKSQKFWESTRNFNLVKNGQLSADHNTYWGRWWGKAPRSKIAAGSRSLVGPQIFQSLCVTPRQSWGSHPRHHQARQTNLRYRINQKSKVKHIPDLKSQIVHLQGKLVQVWPPAFLSPTHTKAASWNPQYLAVRVILMQTRSTQFWLELRRNVGSCRDWAHTHTQCLCTCRHRCDPFWGEKIASERSGTAVGAEVMPSALCPLWTNPSTS